VIADLGSVRPGVPTLTVGPRGMAAVIVEARTLAGPKHSGQFGGAGPDALIALLHALATLHDENGDVAVEGLRRETWEQNKWIARALTDAFIACETMFTAAQRSFPYATPWQEANPWSTPTGIADRAAAVRHLEAAVRVVREQYGSVSIPCGDFGTGRK